MAEFDPGTDGLEPVDTAHPLEGRPDRAGDFRGPGRPGAAVPAYVRFRVGKARSVRAEAGLATSSALVVAVALFWTVINGVLFGLRCTPRIRPSGRFDELIEPETNSRPTLARPAAAPPCSSGTSLDAPDGSSSRRGRPARICAHFRERTRSKPIRVYVGLRSAETPRERAKLALEELKRVGGFDRSVLIVVMPTGTGWIDPAAMDSVEYLHGGDVASVAVQYSYLASWLSLLVEPGYGADAARALFTEIYNYWTRLPKESRPNSICTA